MTAKHKAEELVNTMYYSGRYNGDYIAMEVWQHIKKCALIAVQNIILSNPHSNPFNTNIYSTMDYWLEVKTEIENIKL